MKQFFSKYLEFVLIFLALLAQFGLYSEWYLASAMFVVAFSLVAFYYLLSGQLVLSNKEFPQSVRLSYVIGFWGVAIGFVAWVFKVLLWANSTILLLTAISSSIVCMLFILIVLRNKEIEEKKTFVQMFRPLTRRLVPFALVFFAAYMIPGKVIFQNFTPFRYDQKLMEFTFQSLENPDNYALKDSIIERKKYLLDQEGRLNPEIPN